MTKSRILISRIELEAADAPAQAPLDLTPPDVPRAPEPAKAGCGPVAAVILFASVALPILLLTF